MKAASSSDLKTFITGVDGAQKLPSSMSFKDLPNMTNLDFPAPRAQEINDHYFKLLCNIPRGLVHTHHPAIIRH